MVRVVITGDFHTGLKGALDSDIIYNIALVYWKDKPVLLMGDLCDFGLDRGMEFGNEKNPAEQIKKLKRITDLLDVRGHVLGNHCTRMIKAVGMDPYELFLGPEQDRITIDNVDFLLYHGKSAAQDMWNEHRKLMLFTKATVYCIGHNHQLCKRDVLRDGERVTLLRTGSFVDNPDYARRAGYPPAMAGWCEYDTVDRMARLYLVSKEGVVEEI